MRPRIWWADLIRIQAAGLGDAAVAATLEMTGLEGFGRIDFEDRGSSTEVLASGTEVTPAIPRSADRPVEPRFWLRAAEFKALKPLPVFVPGAAPRAPLVAPLPAALPPKAPATPELSPWPRLLRFLEVALRREVPSTRLDLPRLLRRLGSGRALREIPREPRLRWAAQGLLIQQVHHRLFPFLEDQRRFVEGVRALRGEAGILVQAWQLSPESEHLAWIVESLPATAPVLVLGDLGIYEGAASVRAWLRFGEALAERGHALAALAPVPSVRFPAELARRWNVVPWEPEFGPGRVRDPAERDARAERLLRLLAFAVRVEPGLLRAVRRVLPTDEADVGTEADAWNHAGMTGHSAAAGTLDAAFASVRRRELLQASPEEEAWLRRVTDLLAEWHRSLPPWIGREEVLNAAALRVLSEDDPRVVAARTAVLALARDLDGAFASAEERERFLHFFRRFNVRASEEVWHFDSDPALRDAMLQLWGAAHEDQDTAKTPPGYDPRTRRVVVGETPSPDSVSVTLHGRELVCARSARVRAPGFLLGSVVTSSDFVTIAPKGAAGSRLRLPETTPIATPLPPGTSITVKTELQELTITASAAPPWASSSGYDRFGFWADLEVEGVVQRMRWVPPGSYRQGSPEDEPGRWDDEGPQRTVVFTKGFWLGDTPVTQALWVAVMGTNPSRFQSPDRPVEQVTWVDAEKFHRKLRESVPAFVAGFPGEAEWEYACRGGTTDATYAGPIEIKGLNNAPVLDAIAWYGRNAGIDFELPKGEDVAWSERQYNESRKGGTHRVKQRLPNPWGFYDMLGNVLEWCADAWNFDEPYAVGDVIDPQPLSQGSERVCRGGSWNSSARCVRAAYRCARDPGHRYDDVGLGFRLSEVSGRDRQGEGRGGAATPESAGRPAERSGSGASRTSRGRRPK